MSQKQILSLPDVSATVNAFRIETKNKISKYAAHEVFNSDQSGFNIEQLSGRTLAERGSADVISSIRQSFSMTHSYTIQPLISSNGELKQPLFIVLQEKDGSFGPLVTANLFRHPEIFVQCSTSGKLTKELLKKWFAEVYFKSFTSKSLLLLDSYSGHKDLNEVNKRLPRGKTFEVAQLPPGITGFCQPLDLYFFRPYKSFHRRLSDYINYHRPDIKLHERNIVLKLQAAVFFQFRSPRFHQFIQYAWVKAGLHDSFVHTDRFEDPVQFCFDQIFDTHQCTATNCNEICIIRCSWCKKLLCFDHFFLKPLELGDPSFLQIHYCKAYDWSDF